MAQQFLLLYFTARLASNNCLLEELICLAFRRAQSNLLKVSFARSHLANRQSAPGPIAANTRCYSR